MKCNNCGSDKVVFTGNMLTTCPPQTEHKCEECGATWGVLRHPVLNAGQPSGFMEIKSNAPAPLLGFICGAPVTSGSDRVTISDNSSWATVTGSRAVNIHHHALVGVRQKLEEFLDPAIISCNDDIHEIIESINDALK